MSRAKAGFISLAICDRYSASGNRAVPGKRISKPELAPGYIPRPSQPWALQHLPNLYGPIVLDDLTGLQRLLLRIPATVLIRSEQPFVYTVH